MHAHLPAGELDRRVTIQRNAATRDPSFGSEVDNWVPIATNVPARRLDVQQRETSADGIRVARRVSGYRIRYRTDVTAAMRVVEGTRVCNIMGVTEYGKRVGLDLECEEFSA